MLVKLQSCSIPHPTRLRPLPPHLLDFFFLHLFHTSIFLFTRCSRRREELDAIVCVYIVSILVSGVGAIAAAAFRGLLSFAKVISCRSRSCSSNLVISSFGKSSLTTLRGFFALRQVFLHHFYNYIFWLFTVTCGNLSRMFVIFSFTIIHSSSEIPLAFVFRLVLYMTTLLVQLLLPATRSAFEGRIQAPRVKA